MRSTYFQVFLYLFVGVLVHGIAGSAGGIGLNYGLLEPMSPLLDAALTVLFWPALLLGFVYHMIVFGR